ncbi:uncharacterized protein LOC105178411 [Sesamum indicum]|uniref:Uncharacterized protein LOC105178411 n=1 Tax=Sesamum indicum TaxID=4182 RepID=A0A6I9UFK3_SESIN|nr:uncharacterized protein LOC105178411 [Sesamum indicum]
MWQITKQEKIVHNGKQFEGGGERNGKEGIVVGIVGIEGIVGNEKAGNGGRATFGIAGMEVGNGGNVGFGRDGMVGRVGMRGMLGNGGNVALGKFGIVGRGGIVGNAGCTG